VLVCCQQLKAALSAPAACRNACAHSTSLLSLHWYRWVTCMCWSARFYENETWYQQHNYIHPMWQVAHHYSLI
jgi:hypothetical protein